MIRTICRQPEISDWVPSRDTCIKQTHRNWPHDRSGTHDTCCAVQVLLELWRKASVLDGVSAEFQPVPESNRGRSEPFLNQQALPDWTKRSKRIDRSGPVLPQHPEQTALTRPIHHQIKDLCRIISLPGEQLDQRKLSPGGARGPRILPPGRLQPST